MLTNYVLSFKCNYPPPPPPQKKKIRLMKSTSFPNYVSETIISIDKVPAILRAFKVIIFCPTTEHSGIWVGRHRRQKTLDWVLSAVKTSLEYLCFIFYQKWTRLLNERIVSSSDTIRSLATIRTAMMYVYIASRQSSPSLCQSRTTIGRPIWQIY